MNPNANPKSDPDTERRIALLDAEIARITTDLDRISAVVNKMRAFRRGRINALEQLNNGATGPTSLLAKQGTFDFDMPIHALMDEIVLRHKAIRDLNIERNKLEEILESKT